MEPLRETFELINLLLINLPFTITDLIVTQITGSVTLLQLLANVASCVSAWKAFIVKIIQSDKGIALYTRIIIFRINTQVA
jgi:hypothetical protein